MLRSMDAMRLNHGEGVEASRRPCATDVITIRASTVCDLELVRRLRLEALSSHPDSFESSYETEVQEPDLFWQQRVMHSDHHTVLLAGLGGALVGMCGVTLGTSPKRAHGALIWGLYTHRSARGRGVGTRLIMSCAEWARSSDALLIRSSVNAENLSSIRTFLRCGFRVYGVEPSATRTTNGLCDDILMWRPLGAGREAGTATS